MAWTRILKDPVLDVMVEMAFATNPLSASPTFVDITDRLVRSVRVRGRQDELERDEIATLELTLRNRDRALDPTFVGSPFYPNVISTRRIRMRLRLDGVTVYPYFDGFTGKWPWSQVGPHHSDITIQCRDPFELVQRNIVSGVFPEESSSSRIVRVLDLIGWPAARRSIYAGQSVVAAETVDRANALAYMREIAEAEDGRLFVNANGDIVFHDRHRKLLAYGTSAATYGDGPTFGWGENLARISNFEVVGDQGSFEGYNGGAGIVPVLTQVPTGGEYGTGMRITAQNAEGIARSKYVWQQTFDAVAVTPGERIRLRSWVNGDGGFWIGARIASGTGAGNFYDAQNVPGQFEAGGFVDSASLPGGRGYLEKVFIVPAGATSIQIGWHTFVPAGSTRATTIDAVEIRRVAPVEIPYLDIGREPDDEKIRNEVIGQRGIAAEGETPPVFISSDAASELRHGPRSLSITPKLAFDTEVESRVAGLLNRYKDETTRFTTMKLSATMDNRIPLRLLGDDLSTRLTVRQRPLRIGTTFEQQVHIERVTDEMAQPKEGFYWNADLELSPAETVGYWILGTSALGTGTRLTY